MATLSLKIGNVESTITVDNQVALNICTRAWEAYHRNNEIATDKEKLEWVVDKLLRKSLTEASARKERVEQREQRKLEMEARREERHALREPKFKFE